MAPVNDPFTWPNSSDSRKLRRTLHRDLSLAAEHVHSILSRSIRLLSHGKFPAPPDRDEAQPDTKNATYRGHRRGPGKNGVAKDNDRSARKGRDGIELGGKDDRYFRDKDITCRSEE